MAVGGGGEFLDRVHNDAVFEQVLSRVSRLPEMDPSLAFADALPGFLGDITQSFGPWPGRDTQRWAIDGKSDAGKAIGPDQRARVGGVSERHIVAVPGTEIAGISQKVGDKDFLYGSMAMEQAERKAILPIRSFNERVANIMMNVATSGDFSGSPADNFAWTTPNQDGETVTQDLVTASANQVADVFINGSQSTFVWPLRNGTETGTGHDHIVDTGAAWVLAQQATARDNILEHPNMGRVRAYVGTTVAAAVRLAAKSEYGAISERVQFISGGDVRSNGFAYATPMGIVMDTIEYYYAPDLPTSVSVTVAGNVKPLHAHIGQVGAGGRSTDKGAWSERGDAERGGIYYGFRKTLSAGVRVPTAIVVTEHAA